LHFTGSRHAEGLITVRKYVLLSFNCVFYCERSREGRAEQKDPGILKLK